MRLRVPGGCSVRLAVQVAVAPGATPATLAEMRTEVFCKTFAGTATTAGDTVTVPTLTATTLPTEAMNSAVRMAAMAAVRLMRIDVSSGRVQF